MILSIVLYIYTNVSSNKLCACIVTNGGQAYAWQQITSRCTELDLIRKCLFRKAYNAFSANIIRKLEWFVSPPPSGEHDLSIANFIDIAETGFYLKGLASKSGRAHTSFRIRHPSHYCHGEPNVNLMMGIEAGDPRLPPGVDGSTKRPRRWRHVSQVNCDQ